jgi:hypothetical protein
LWLGHMGVECHAVQSMTGLRSHCELVPIGLAYPMFRTGSGPPTKPFLLISFDIYYT